MNPVTNAIQKFRRMPKLARYRYAAYYERLRVTDDTILIECFNGDGLMGNPFWLLKEICKDERLTGYKIYVAANPKYLASVRSTLAAHGLERAVAVVKYDRLYLRLLASAKYIITDVSLPIFFIKKPGQVLLNTWHGTPLKGLGRSVANHPHTIGNVQRIFLMTDTLLCPNRFTFDVLRDDYMIGPFFKGKYVLSGYPRNSVLFDAGTAAGVRRKLGLEGKRLAVYMPTWRDCETGSEKQYHSGMLAAALAALDSSGGDDLVVVAKLHHLASESIDFSRYSRVIPFPEGMEAYELLAAADCLITDYSSVMFDFAVTGRKIVLYAYDSEDYRKTRSMYFPVTDLPFPVATDPDGLAREVVSPEYAPYGDEMEKFTRYDCPDAPEKLTELLFFGVQSDGMEIIDGSQFHNDRPDILIYAGNLMRNGVTTALTGLLDNIDTSRFNILLTFYQKLVGESRDTLSRFGRDVGFIGMPDGKPITYYEAICQYLYFHLNVNLGFTRKAVRKLSGRDALRCFGGTRFHAAIHYTGYEKFIIHLIDAMDTRKIIYIHSNMMKERKARNRSTIHYNTLMTAYRDFDKIAVVRESMEREIRSCMPSIPDGKIHTAHNINNIGFITRMAQEPVSFDGDTWCNLPQERVREILDDDSVVKFINIARFSVEKRLDGLVEAFSRFTKEHGDACLFIVGNHGPLFDDLCRQVSETGLDNIVIIRSMSNPYSVLSRCDAFILSSIYEGLPMTIMEALILGKPVICTDITGPADFLRQTGCGLIVPSSVDGLADGFDSWYDGRLGSLKQFDAESFNENAKREFYRLIE